MLVSAAVCPHPPALVPAVSRSGAARLDDVRRSCIDALRRIAETDPDLVVCVGAGPSTERWPTDVSGSLREYGPDIVVGSGPPVLPLSLTVARFLLNESDLVGDVFQSVAASASSGECGELGRGLAGLATRVALVVAADGSAKLTDESPGYVDPRAPGFDDALFGALAAPDPDALLGVDPALCDELWVAGRPALQVLAGALEESPVGWTADLTHRSAPLGVGYATAFLTRQG